jgi:hypothetical protein
MDVLKEHIHRVTLNVVLNAVHLLALLGAIPHLVALASHRQGDALHRLLLEAILATELLHIIADRHAVGKRAHNWVTSFEVLRCNHETATLRRVDDVEGHVWKPDRH